MNFVPDKLGGSRKQVMWLVGLTVVLVAVYFMEREPSSPTVAALGETSAEIDCAAGSGGAG